MAYLPQPPSTQHILVEPYCILCRSTLISFTGRHLPKEARKRWNIDVFCFFELCSRSSEHESTQPRTHIFRANLGHMEWLKGSPDTKKVLEEAKLSLCPESCDHCDTESVANMVHSTCLLLLRSRVQDIEIKASLLCKVARRLQPLLGWMRGVTMGLAFEHSPSLALSNFGNSTSDPLLSAIQQKLPWELQRMIVQRLSGSFASSLSNCLATVESIDWSQFTEEAIPRTRFQHSYPFSDLTSTPTRLSASAVDILGEICLASIGSESGLDLEISVAESPMRGVEFAFGLHGIVSFRLLYADGSSSLWLGNGRRKWSTRIRCQGLDKLRVVADGFKIVSMRLGEHSPDQTHSHMVWNHRNPSFSPVKKRYSFIDTGEKALSPRGNHRAHFGTFLPMKLNQDQNNSLTIFCDGGGICSILLNDQPRLGVTNPRCCATTYYLRPGETLESCHVLSQGDRYPFLLQGPYLLIITSKKRSLAYAPHRLPYQRRFHSSSFDDTGSSFVSGILFDPSTANTRRRGTIGVELTPRNTSGGQPSQEVAIYPFTPSFERFSFPSVYSRIAFLTKSDLRDTQMLRLQRFGPRCVGLQITRTNGIIDILGQWDPSRTDCITVLHEESNRNVLGSLAFVFSESRDRDMKYCQDILVNPTETSGPVFRWQNLHQTVAWWYTYQYDFVEPWTGNDRSIDIGERHITPTFAE